MGETINSESTQTISKVVAQIRKPEARSPYSDILTSIMQKYLKELFDQPQQSPIITEMKQRHGLVLFEGSVLRGSATEKTHDLDIFVMVDDQLLDPELSNELQIFTRDIEQFHPTKKPFSDYLMRQLQSDPEMNPFYEARISELQRIKDYIDKSYQKPPGPAKIESHNFIHTDTLFEQLPNFLDAIEAGDDTALNKNEIPTRIIVSLLTATPDLVYEVVPGSLSYHQQKIVEALTKLKDTNPDKFNTFYALLGKDFINLHRSTSWRYPERDFRLLGEYYIRSGRFTPQHIETKQLIDIVTRRLTHMVITSEFNRLITRYDVYKNNPEELLTYMTRYFGLETGLAREDLEKISRGETLANQSEKNLSPEALRELADFEKRIKMLAAIRNHIKMPTLEEFQQAYLINN